MTPIQDHTYELALTVSRYCLAREGASALTEFDAALRRHAVRSALQVECAVGAQSRTHFGQSLYAANQEIRMVKLCLRLLDDLELMDPTVGEHLGDMAEEAHRVVLAAIRTSRKVRESESQGVSESESQ
jgi:hypothetical protein